MTVDTARKKVGVASDYALAKWFKVTCTAVQNWRRNGALPPKRENEVRTFAEAKKL